MGSETILFVGAHYEIKNGSEITKYYMAGSTRIAMRKYTIPQNMTVEYMLSDHLGSTSLTADVNGNKVLELRYREASRAVLWRVDNVRWYDSYLSHFTQADTIIPEATQGTQAWDRYAGMNNNTIRYDDPTGHCLSWLWAAIDAVSYYVAQTYFPADANRGAINSSRRLGQQ